MILRLYDLATLSSLITSEISEWNSFPDPGTPSISQYGAISFPVLCHINSHVALSGMAFVVPTRDSTFLLIDWFHMILYTSALADRGGNTDNTGDTPTLF